MTTVLTVVIVIALFWAIRHYTDFSPFRVRIVPTYDLLIEHGLATATMLKSVNPVSDNSLLIRGIGFTLLRVGWQSSAGTLVYWDDFKSFSTEIEMNVEIPELAIGATGLAAAIGLDSIAPSFYVEQKFGGLEIGMVPASDKPSERKQQIAFLPWAEFGIPQWKQGTASRRKRERLLAQSGWTRDDNQFESFTVHSLTHKYVRVEWNYI